MLGRRTKSTAQPNGPTLPFCPFIFLGFLLTLARNNKNTLIGIPGTPKFALKLPSLGRPAPNKDSRLL